MQKYKIEVSYTRVFEIDADDSYDAREKARQRALDDVKEITTRGFDAREWEAERNWTQEAEDGGQSIADELDEVVKEAVRVYKDSKEGAKSSDTVEYDETDVQSVFDIIYQEEDTWNKASEYADSYFMYNSTDALVEAMHCIDELENYASGDSGLWEDQSDYASIINIQACDALRGGVHSYAEDIIKVTISDLLSA